MTSDNSGALNIINDFSRQLFLIKTPADFNKGLTDIFGCVLPHIELFIIFRYQWENDEFSVISSNYIKELDDIPLDKEILKNHLFSIIHDNKIVCNSDLTTNRKEDILKVLNTATAGSEILLPLIPVNEPVGIMYAYTRKPGFFSSENLEIMRLTGNMIARTWNIVHYQAHQIKSHKKAELEMVNQKNFMNEIFDYLPINIFIKDEDGKFIYLNKNSEESHGFSLEDVKGKTARDIYPESTARELENDDDLIRKKKRPLIKEYELEINGRKRNYIIGKKLMSTADQRELLIGFAVDVTQNIMANKAIEEQKKFFQQIFDTVPNYIYVKNKNGRYMMVNESGAKHFGLTKEEILKPGAIDPEEFQMDEKLNAETDEQVLKTGQSLEYEEAITLKNGEKRWYHTTKKPLPDKDGAINILGISVDITERKKHSDELMKAKLAKEQFLANMSHEIRTPINGIVGMVNLLEEIPATEEQKKYLNAIKTSSENLQVIINDILDLSAIESGNIKFEHINFNLRNFFNTLISSFGYAAKQKGLNITLNFDPYIDETVVGDPVRLNQIMSNLIGNAVKFTRRGYVKVYALKLDEQDGVGLFQFIVDDSGIGIPEDKIQKVFENFEQGDAAITRKYGGTGLGLAIARQLVEAQSGSIKVESKVGKGTKFTVNLRYPIGPTKNEQEEEVADYDIADGQLDLSKYKLLLVEDNEVNLLYTKKILQKWHCIPDEAKNGLDALEKIKEKDYDLILMDVRMPSMDGFEATKFIRNNFNPPKSNVPIIALTANAIKGDDQRCFNVGMNDYLSKPFQPETLRNKIISNMHLEGFSKKISSQPIIHHDPLRTTDLSYLRSMSDNDTKFIIEMVQSFINQTPEDLIKIKDHFYKNELDETANLLHKMKPSIAFMGIHQLKDKIVEMENLARKGDAAKLEGQLNFFESTCFKAIDELKEEMVTFQ